MQNQMKMKILKSRLDFSRLASRPFRDWIKLVGSNQLIEAKGKKARGRLYPWGVVEVENPEHNDFLKLRTMLITHMQDLQEVTQDLHYENLRSERLKRGGRKVENEDMNKDQILLEKEAELRRMQEMIARMQAQMQMQMQGWGWRWRGSRAPRVR